VRPLLDVIDELDGWDPRPIGVYYYYRYCFLFIHFLCFLSPSFSGSLFFCRVVAWCVVARFLRRAVQVLDRLVASLPEPWALSLLWWLGPS